jgi:hypothetical protein
MVGKVIQSVSPPGQGVVALLEDVLAELKLNNKLMMELIKSGKSETVPKFMPAVESEIPKKQRGRPKKL